MTTPPTPTRRIDVERLRDLARKATPGPWRWLNVPQTGSSMPTLTNDVSDICDFGDDSTYYPTEGDPPDSNDMAYIAGMSPDVILALLAELETSRVLIDNLRHGGAVNGAEFIGTKDAWAAYDRALAGDTP